MSSDTVKAYAAGVCSGCIAAFAVGKCLALRTGRGRPVEYNSVRQDPQRVLEADDSLFYGNRTELTEVLPEAKMLPEEIYGEIVRRVPVVCVDVVIQRSTGEVLLVRRGMEPVKGYWWWPGGRMLKGETFFSAAKRKAQQETGLECTPQKLLGTYNTVFPTSSWDTLTTQGTQTVNAVVLVSAPPETRDVALDATSDNHRWIAASASAAAKEGHDRYVVEQLKRL